MVRIDNLHTKVLSNTINKQIGKPTVEIFYFMAITYFFNIFLCKNVTTHSVHA